MSTRTTSAKTLRTYGRFARHRLRTLLLDPFRFQAMRAGLTWSTGQVTLAVVGRTRRGIRVVETVAVPVPDTSPAALTTALTRVRGQQPGYLPPVIVGLDSTIIGYRLLTPPDPLPADLPAWVVTQAAQLVPPGLRLAELTLDFRVVRRKERSFIQVVWARRARLEALIEQVEAAGFQVVGVYPHALAEVERLRELPDTTAAVLLCQPAAITFIPVMESLPHHLHEIAWAAPDPETAWDDLTTRIRSLLVGYAQDGTLALVTPPDLSALGTTIARTLDHQGVRVTPTTGSTDALALAQGGLDATRPPFQLLPARVNRWEQQEQDRRWALRIGWGGGMLIAVLCLVGLLLHQSYARQQQALAVGWASQGPRIAQMSALTGLETRLVAEVRALHTERTERPRLAACLETIGRAVPDQLWLRALRVERQASTGQYQVQLTGFARQDSALRTFLTNLETQTPWRPRGTFTTARWEPEKVQQQMGVRISLIHVELTLVATEAVGTQRIAAGRSP